MVAAVVAAVVPAPAAATAADDPTIAATAATADGEPSPALPIHATMLDHWNARYGAYDRVPGSPGTRLNAQMLRLHVKAVTDPSAGLPSGYADRARIIELVDVLSSAPAFVDGRRTRYDRSDPSHRHRPGFTQIVGRGRGTGRTDPQHIAIDPEVALALAEAYRAADRIGLPAALRSRVRRVVLRVASHGMFSPRQVRIGQLLWTADMLWARYLVDGRRRAWVRDYRRALDTQRELLPRLLTRDGGYRYAPQSLDDLINRMDTPEYSLISLAGARYMPQARRAGMPLRRGELGYYRRWARRVTWGAFANDGGLNWDTGWGAQRRYLTQYWGWAAIELQAIVGATTFLGRADRDRIRRLCGRIRKRYVAEADEAGFLPQTLHGARTRFAIAGSDRALASVRLARAVEDCGPATSSPGAPTAAASFDRDQPRYAVTTARYSTAVVGWSRDLVAGVLPARLLDADGVAIGGLGGRRSTFDLHAGSLRLGQGHAAGVGVRLSARPGSGPLAGRSVLRGRIVRGSRSATVRTRFTGSGFSVTGRLDRTSPRRWRIPLGGTSSLEATRRASSTTVAITPRVGAHWSVTVGGRARVGTAAVRSDPLDPTVRRVLVLTLPRGRSIDLRVRVGVAR